MDPEADAVLFFCFFGMLHVHPFLRRSRIESSGLPLMITTPFFFLHGACL